MQEILQKYQSEFHPVVDFHPGVEKLLMLDFTAANSYLTPALLENTGQFAAYIEQQLTSAGAKYGIGGYGENRTVYSRSKHFGEAEEEPRRWHLGVDIWGKTYTAVRAPLNGIVHSFGFNNNFGDYGATIILTHILDDITFHTLYGHLSLNDLKNLEEGQMIMKGDIFGEFGLAYENGHWPPHLHFQVIDDIGEYRADYPGVCRASEKDFYFSNCPDPDIILQMNQYV